MITEPQIRRLLTYCEDFSGYEYDSLRKRLTNDRNHVATIWELVWLYWMTQVSESLTPESKQGQPDLIAQTVSGEIAVEVTAVLARPEYDSEAVRCPEDHAAYKAIARKKRQLKRWDRALEVPLVLAVCSETPTSCMSNFGGTCEIRTDQAVAAALLDEQRLGYQEIVSVTAAYNHRKLRVSGSGAVSAVIVVTLETEYDTLKKVARAEIFLNPLATVPLPQSTLSLLSRINLASIDFGMGWVDWTPKDKGNLCERAQHRITGSFIMTANSVEIPQSALTELLAGKTTANDLFKGDGWDYTTVIKRFIQQNREIKTIELIEPQPGAREDPKVRIIWSDPPSPVVATRKR